MSKVQGGKGCKGPAVARVRATRRTHYSHHLLCVDSERSMGGYLCPFRADFLNGTAIRHFPLVLAVVPPLDLEIIV